jgi:hypothetical protein
MKLIELLESQHSVKDLIAAARAAGEKTYGKDSGGAGVAMDDG